ncbi:MAG: hypothetical protein HKN71_05685, partial [Gemmatimonadetes bacterium]|nr:hypothetical protein [Gemmatimonadota bacterium]
MRWVGYRFTEAVIGSVLLSGALEAQTALVDPRIFAVSPSVQDWVFSDPVRTDSLAISRAGQVSVPVSLSFTPARNWRVDVSGGYTVGRIVLVDASSDSEFTIPLNGPTDAKIRAIGSMLGERIWLTMGVNLPTGRTGLSDDEAVAIRALGAPALRMATPALGRGAGFIIGPVITSRIAGWSVGMGASYELRSSYTPLESTLAGGRTGTVAELDPAGTLHVSVALERLVGQGKMSF